MARITIMGPSGRQERQLFRHNSLGRHPRNTHQVLDRVVSKEHCHIELVEVLVDVLPPVPDVLVEVTPPAPSSSSTSSSSSSSSCGS